ncbi:hypothetical protein [Lysobacter sp. F60174L2]|uniref:hypothetical protein n=1 Tax=Lysobacter sp. F60174L2 TaxID=3459295 RepID=UPI00403DC742
MQRVLAVLTIAALPTIAGASGSPGDHYHDLTIHQASALVPWCRSEAEARYIARNIVPYQWTARYHDKGNVLYVEGKLRVHGDDVAVRCRIARGAREKYAVIEIDDPSL